MFYTVPTLYQVQASLKSSSLLPTSITLSPFQYIGKVYCYQCVPAESQIFSFNILLRKFKLWPQWFLGLCSNYQPYLHHTELFIACDPNASCIFWPLPINQLPGTLLLRPQKTQFKCHHPLHEAFMTSQTKFISPGPTILQHCETITLFYFIPVHWNHCGFPIISSPNRDCDLLKEKTMSPISVPGLRMGTHWVLKDNVRQKWKYYFSTVPSAQSFITGQLKLDRVLLSISVLPSTVPQCHINNSQPHSGYIPLQQE